MIKKIKLISLVIIALFLLTGCDAVINVNINKSYISQTFDITMDKNEITKDNAYLTVQDAIFNTEFDTEMLGNYSIKNTNSKGATSFTATRRFNIKKYVGDPALNICYGGYTTSFEDNIFKLSTTSKFTCFDRYLMMDNLTINLTTGDDVINHNADTVRGNTYTWKLSRGNHNKSIIMEIDYTNVVDDEEDSSSPTSFFGIEGDFIIIAIIVLGAFLLGLIIYGLVKLRGKTSDRL